jgi:hypothetical protein
MSEKNAWHHLRLTYGAADPRSLGLFRIALGAVMFVDVLRRFPEIQTHYANTGWLTNHFMLFRPMSEHLFSIYLAFSSVWEVRFLMLLHLAACVLFMIGWRTRLMHVLLLLLLVSINSRNIMLENGGSVVLTLLVAWTMFLPLDIRFSLDAVKRSLSERRENSAEALNDRADPPRPVEPVVSLAVFALLLQWVVIYALNAVHKNGPEWRDGTAVYYLFQQDRLISDFAFWFRDRIPLGGYKLLTYAGLGIEGAVALLLASPVLVARARMLAWVLAALLHLGIAAIVDLGPFSWAMLVMFLVLVPASAWERAKKRFDTRFPRLDLFFDRASGFWLKALGVVKRFDVLGHVRFVPVAVGAGAAPPVPVKAETAVNDVEEDEEEEDEDGSPEDEEERKEVAPENGDRDEDEDEDDDEDERPKRSAGKAKPERSSPPSELERLVSRNLLVTSASGERYTGLSAIAVIGRAIPAGRLLTLPIYVPGVRGFVAKRLRRASQHAADTDEYFELESLPKEPERRAPPPSPARVSVRRALAILRETSVAVLIVCSGVQVLVQNPSVPAWLKPRQPPWMKSVIVYPRLFQGWSMFAPSPALADSRLVVDGVTSDGRRLDPLTGEAPVFAVAPPSARHMNQIWGDFHRRIGERAFEPYLEGLKDFIRRHHEVFERRGDKLVAFEAWYVTETIPPPGKPKKPPERRLLFSEGTMPNATPAP